MREWGNGGMGEWGNGGMGNDTASGGSCFPRPFPHCRVTSFSRPLVPTNLYFCCSLSSAVGPYIEGTFWSVRRR
jgi:hypothetical protein